MQYSKPSQPNSTRPSLLSTSTSNEVEDNRILASLESGEADASAYGKKSKGRSGRRRFIVGWLVLVGTLTAWIAHQSTQAPAQPGPDLEVPENLQKVQQGATSATNDRVPFGLLEPEAGSQAAVINDEAAAKIAPPTNPAVGNAIPKQAQATTVPFAPEPSTGELLKALEGTGTNATPASAGTTAPVHAANQAVANKAVANKAARKPPAPQSKQLPRSKTDTDVALLTALVTAASEGEPAQSAPSVSSEAGTKGNRPNRDIVERTANDSTESLLARCKRLGFLEGSLCHWRICSGQESNPACKVH